MVLAIRVLLFCTVKLLTVVEIFGTLVDRLVESVETVQIGAKLNTAPPEKEADLLPP